MAAAALHFDFGFRCPTLASPLGKHLCSCSYCASILLWAHLSSNTDHYHTPLNTGHRSVSSKTFLTIKSYYLPRHKSNVTYQLRPITHVHHISFRVHEFLSTSTLYKIEKHPIIFSCGSAGYRGRSSIFIEIGQTWWQTPRSHISSFSSSYDQVCD